jgi:hypothetical protein
MRIYLAILISLAMTPFAIAGGSLSWDEVTQRLTKECPKLLVVINQCFDVSPSGGALRLGPRSVDVVEGRAGVGDRVPPYEFDCKLKGSAEPYPLTIEISDWGDGWKFIIREKQMKKPAEQAGAGQPSTASESKTEGGENPKPESEPAPR